TDRIVLRNFEADDLNDLYEYCSQDDVGEMAGWMKHTSVSYSRRVLNHYIKNRNLFALVYKENNKVIGHIGINEDSEGERADIKELGYVLNKEYWNKGLMAEAVRAVLAELFERWTGIEYVYACCFQHNPASKKLIEKCGFKFDKEGTVEAKILNKTFCCYEYLYTKEMWES
ncbi:MAG: GNAT family N-acetyltransferase, partial [Clostridium sp.]|nr:GNAT family N-acetyltransferase [Clostridium sp.]